MELFFLAILVLLMGGALASGFPVAFALPGSAIITILLAAGAGLVFEANPDAYFASGGPSNWLSAGVTNFRGIYWEIERDTLIAIPLFVFMGIMLQRSKIAEDLLICMAQLFGPVRGGLGISVVFVGALLAATTGILGATVVAMGLISLPAMMRNKYQNWLSTGTIAASGTLGQIIPPSIVLIILADQLSNAVDQARTSREELYKVATGEFSMPSEFAVSSSSAGDMFMGALVPGLILVGLYMAFIFVVALLRKNVAPPVPFEGEYDRKFVLQVAVALIPPLTLIFVVLGSIIAGIATVNQAGAIGAVGAMVMAGYRLYEGRKLTYVPAAMAGFSLIAILILSNLFNLNVRSIQTDTDALGIALAAFATVIFLTAVVWSGYRALVTNDTLRAVLKDTAKTTALVFIILLGAAMLTSAFRAFGGEELVKDFLRGLPGGFWTQFVIVMIVIFLLGFFLDFIEIAVVVVPIVAPILLADPSANITAVWLGVMIGLNIQTSFLTPPFGFALFYLRGVAPAAVRTIQMYKGVVPFITLQIIGLIVVGSYPPLVNYLPTRISLLADTAPPPQNPRLQACIEEYVHAYYMDNGADLKAALAAGQSWDTSALPRGMRRDLEGALEGAGEAIDLLSLARERSVVVQTAASDYRPIQQNVRRLEAEILDLEEEIDETAKEIDQIERFEQDRMGDIPELRRHLSEMEALLEFDRQAIPANWDAVHEEFAELLKAENQAFLVYRRTADQSYNTIAEITDVLQGTEALAARRDAIAALADVIQNEGDAEVVQDAIQDEERIIGEITGGGDVRSALSKARRAMRTRSNNPPDREQALAEIQTTLTVLDEDIAWRAAASDAFLEDIAALRERIRHNIGLRQQDRMPRNVALSVASCQSSHKDISLSF
jgi:tripartite ATP-independent transporter DctM subunit